MKVLILSGYGINCEDETLHAFTKLGFKGKIIHINDLINFHEKLLITVFFNIFIFVK